MKSAFFGKTALIVSILATMFWTGSLFGADESVITGEVANLHYTEEVISLETVTDFELLSLNLRGPNGYLVQETYRASEVPHISTLDAEGNLLPDGKYSFELRIKPLLNDEVRDLLQEARAENDRGLVADMRAAGLIPSEALVQSGTFRIENGFIIQPVAETLTATLNKTDDGRSSGDRPGTPTGGSEETTPVDVGTNDSDGDSRAQVITTDLVVDGSACVGTDCANGENFGFDTIRLKENNVRIKFDDTSNSGSFPYVDWELIANDSINGGANYFSIMDVSNNKTPFKIEANAANNTLYVSDDSRVGIKTSAPAVDLHIANGDSPTVRLEQNVSSGFAAQTWDVVGNETNFFIRDVTNGSKLPFRIKPNAPKNSIYIDTDGVGVGLENPTSKLHVKNTSDSELADLYIQNAPGTAITGGSLLMTLENNGPVFFSLNNTDGNDNWYIKNSNGLRMDYGNAGSVEFLLRESGNLEISGEIDAQAFNVTSDRNKKENFTSVSPEDVLEKVAELPITTWNYIADDQKTTHLGPMAQDFHKAFGLGKTDKTLSFVDTNGVALASIQALNTKLQEKDLKINALQNQNEMILDQNRAMADKLSQLENMVNTLSRKLSQD